MILKNSVKSLLRTPVKTLLFFILLTAVTVFFVLSLNMLNSSNELLSDADKSFTTIAELEYFGSTYPDDSTLDEALQEYLQTNDVKQLGDGIDEVIEFERYTRVRAYVPGYVFMNDARPYMNDIVIKFRVKSVDKKNGEIKCILLKKLYTYEHTVLSVVEGVDFTMYIDENTPIRSAKEGSMYICYGTWAKDGGYSNNYCLTPKMFLPGAVTRIQAKKIYSALIGSQVYENDFARMYESTGLLGESIFTYVSESNRNAFEEYVKERSEAGRTYESDGWAVVDGEDCTTPNAISLADIWCSAVDTLETLNNSVDAIATSDIMLLPEFQQGEIVITDGRAFTPSDGESVCIISDNMAKALELSVGDTMPLSFHYAKQGDNTESYFAPFGYDHSGEYKIIGIYRAIPDYMSKIYIPRTAKTTWLPNNQTLYKVGTFKINNGSGDSFESAISGRLGQSFDVTVYDQGYESIAAPLRSMGETAVILLAVCALTGIAIIFLFVYMFITKQKSVVGTMLQLGAGEHRTRSYLVLCVLMLVLVSVCVGGVVGYLASDKVLEFAFNIAAKNASVDLRYNAMRTGLGIVSFELDFSSSYTYSMMAAGGVFVISLILAFAFAHNLMLSKREDILNTPAARMRRFNIIFRDAMRSLRRNTGKSALVSGVVAVVLIMIMVFSGVLDSYNNKLDKMYDDISVYGYSTSTSGKLRDGLLLDGAGLQKLVDDGYVTDVCFTYSKRFLPLGRYVEKTDEDGKKYEAYREINEEYIPENAYTKERFMGEVFDWDNIIFTNTLENSPELCYTDTENVVVYADGYNDKSFSKIDAKSVCAMPLSVMEEYGFKLGDKIKVWVAARDSYGDGFVFSTDKFTIAAYFVSQTFENNMYCPIATLTGSAVQYYHMTTDGEITPIQTDYVPTEDDPEGVGDKLGKGEEKKTEATLSNYININSFSFRMSNSRKVAEFKAYLEENGYGYPSKLGQNRQAFIIDDSALTSSISSTVKIIGYMETLYPVIFVIIIAVGFIISYILTKSRRAELAIMRSAGAGTGKTFFAFFIEQFVLCIIGGGIGTLISYLIYGGITLQQLYSLGIFIGCYTVGIIFAVAVMNRVNVLKLLSTDE